MQDVHEQKLESEQVRQGDWHIRLCDHNFSNWEQLYIYFMRFYELAISDHKYQSGQHQNLMQFKNEVEINKNLKVVRLGADKVGAKTLWIFQHSPYQIHIIDISMPYPHHKICLQNPLQHFDTIQCSNHAYLIIVNNTETWIAYDIQIDSNKKGIMINQISQSLLQSIQHKTIGIHLIQAKQMMILFVKETGKLEYNYLNTQQSTMKTLKMNKLYIIEQSNEKYRNSNLFSKFKGRELLETYEDNQSKVINSAFNLLKSELYIVTEDLSSKICSIFRFFLQDYQVMTGSDFLLNLTAKPTQILIVDGISVVNLGQSIIIWSNSSIEVQKFNQEGLCTSLTLADKNTLIACISKVNQSCIYSITLPQSQKQPKKFPTKPQLILPIPLQLLHYSAVDPSKPHPSLCLTTKLQIILYEKDSTFKTILPNMSSTILSAKFYSNQYCNYLDVVKRVGYYVQGKIDTNNRVVVGVEEYQHNLMVKMADVVSYGVQGQDAYVYLSSPIIGTIKLSLTIPNPKSPQPPITLTLPTPPKPISQTQQSLTLNPQKLLQITPTKLTLPNPKPTTNPTHTAHTAHTISTIFQGKVDFILSSCVVGNYVLLAVEKQVHVFVTEPKFARLHICCLDSQVRVLVGLNQVNVWGGVLWDGSMIVMRIDQKQSVKIKEITGIDSQKYFQYDCSINTAPYKSTIISQTLLLTSNDPLHIYQPQKTCTQILPLPTSSIGSTYYPLIQIPTTKTQPSSTSTSTPSSSSSSTSSDKYKLLANKDDVWAIVSFPMKCLVKSLEEIRMDVEVVVGLREVQGLVFGVVRGDLVVLVGVSRIVVCGLQTGSIVYRQISTFQALLPKTIKTSDNQHLKNWLESQQTPVQSLHLPQTHAEILTQTPAPTILKLSQSRILLYNTKQIWYCSLSPNPPSDPNPNPTRIKQKQIKLISYFSIPNDAFIQFRNNLSIGELENDAFMDMFVEKLGILGVAAINAGLFGVLYSRMIVIVEIKNNGAMAIKQQLLFTEYPQIISITHFLGSHNSTNLYMKDTSHRLILLKYHQKINKYSLEVLDQIEDEVVCINRANGWRESVRRVDLRGEQLEVMENVVVRKDGQLIVGDNNRPVYL